MTNANTVSPVRRWDASLSLVFAPRFGATRLVEKRHQGPLRVQKTFTQADGNEHCYLLHPPSGTVGGDRLDISVKAEAGSHCLIATPGSAKSYRDNGFPSYTTQSVTVGENARLDWLPWENILFRGANAHSQLNLSLHNSAQMVAFDSWCFGRPSCEEVFDQGFWRSEARVNVDDRLVLLDQAQILGGDDSLTSPTGLDGCAFAGTVICYPITPKWLDQVRETVATPADARWGISQVEGVGVARIISRSAESMNAVQQAIWQAHYQTFKGQSPAKPRIWNT